MPLDTSEISYARNLAAKKQEELSQAHQRKLKEFESLPRGGGRDSAIASEHLSYLRGSAEARAQAYVEAFKLFEKPIEASDIAAIVKEISEGLEHGRRSAAELRSFKMSQDFQVELGAIPAVIRRDLNLERQKLDAQRKNTSTPFRPDAVPSGAHAEAAEQPALELTDSIAAVLNGHRQGFADIDQTVALLERLESNLRSEGQRRDFFLNLLWSFQAEPFHPSDQRPYSNVHAVVIRVWAKRGPTDELAEHAFKPLTYEKPEVVEGWLRWVSPEIIYSLGNNPKRFPKSAREALARYCKLYANRDFASLEAGVQEKLQQSIQRIESQIKRIEFLEIQEQLPEAEVEVSVNMPKKKNDANKQEPAKLTVPRADAESKIQGQLEKGRRLKGTELSSEDTLKQCRQQYYRWDEYNFELLQRIFSNNSVAMEYRGYSFGGLDADESFQRRAKELFDDIDYKIGSLESIVARLELIPEDVDVSSSTSSIKTTIGNPSVKRRKVFIVHGHDEAAKLAAARFVERLGLEAVILHEKASGGRTVIEKVEGHSDVGFAVVLLTPDDVGAPKAAPTDLKPRARQNVIFELGFFVGKLGRKNVCVLYKGVEIPSDFEGVVRVEMDTAGAWHMQIAKEIKHAGIDVDLNRAL